MFDWIAESHEEADNRLILHMKDMILNNHVIRIHVRSVDTDVMIILLSFMPQFLEYNENVDVWLDHGRGDGRKTYHINKLYHELGDSLCLGLPFFHTFTGCDSTSSFYGRPKRAFYNHWMSYDRTNDVTLAFQQLSWLPTLEKVEANMAVLERFVATLYAHGIENDDFSINNARFHHLAFIN